MLVKVICGVILGIDVLGFNILYWCKVVPSLQREWIPKNDTDVHSTSFWVSHIRQHIRDYIKLLEKQGKTPWFIPLLRHFDEIHVIMLIVFLIGFLDHRIR